MTTKYSSLKTKIALKQCGEKIRIARRRRKVSVSALALKLRVSRGTIERLERGEAGVSMGIFMEVLNMFDLLDGLLVSLSEYNDIVAIDSEVKKTRINTILNTVQKASIPEDIDMDF